MIALKKLYGDELLRLALVLSLLKANPNDYLERETQQLMAGLHISNGSDWSLEQESRTLITPRYIHPKSLDHMLINYERDLFEELNSLGRYNSIVDNSRILNANGPILHTYLVNNVSTDTVAPPSASENGVDNDEIVNDGVSADENVAQEIKVTEEEEQIEEPDAVVTLSADFLENRTESDIFAEIASRTFDVNEFLVDNAMHIKKENDDILDVTVKIERNEDLYDDNAIDDFVPFFTSKKEIEMGESHSVFDQNMADLQDYSDFFEDVKDVRNNFDYLDVKQQQEDLEKYLLENTPVEVEADEVYDLAPMFDEELRLDVKRERASTSFTSASSSGVSEMEAPSDVDPVKVEEDEGHHTGDELTQEDVDLIEVLWKQDVDMGFILPSPLLSQDVSEAKKVEIEAEVDKELKKAEAKIQEEKSKLLEDANKDQDPWSGLSYTVDTETGEYILQGELPRELVNEESRFDLLEEALQLVELGEDTAKDGDNQAVEDNSDDMLHPAMARHPMPPHHPLAHYHNQSLMRSMSVEQRWQDLASLLTIPHPPDQYQHYHHHQQHPHNMSAHGAAGYTPNYAPITSVPEKHQETYGPPPIDGAYKLESVHHNPQHDPVYYQQNNTAEIGASNSDGFLQSILNDEDLQLMDMAMNDSMYTMRILDSSGSNTHHHAPPQNHTHMMMTTTQERDSASDSAVSSMGSERVPSLSDGEWCDAGSDSAQEYHSSKFRPYDNAYGRDRASGSQPQKKHHMFGKRCFQDQPQSNLDPLAGRPHVPVKYECPEQTYGHENMHMHNVDYNRQQAIPHPHPSHMPFQPALDLNSAHSSHLLQPMLPAAPDRVRHNHTYSTPLVGQLHGRPERERERRVRRMTDGSVSDGGSTSSSGHLSRDEKRAKSLGIPMEVQDIINLPMDEFNERLSKHDLSEAQLSLIRDIRRRGKNKVAAQNCRKRKLEQITSLADEVRVVRVRKQRVERDRVSLRTRRNALDRALAALYEHLMRNLRDSEGRPISSSEYSLQQAADGNVVLIPKMHHHDHTLNRTDDSMDRKAKGFDQ